MSIEHKIHKGKIMAVIRHADETNIVPIIESLHEGGITLIEITAETPKVTRLLEKATAVFDDEVVIGVGTVLDAETTRLAMLAGAQFIVTPTLNIDVIKMANRYGIFVISVVLTLTEILTAYEHGADMIKVFPANSLGADYIKNILGPLGYIPLMVTGGISLENMNDYFQAGCYAIGIGSSLVDPVKL